MTVGIHRALFSLPGDPDVTGDLSCDVDDVTIHRGRDDPDNQPEASTATLTMPGALPTGVDMGSRVAVDTLLPDGLTWSRRFLGTVTDASATWEAGGPEGVRPQSTITAAGPLADLGRRVLGDAPWPQESDGDRIARVLLLTDIPVGLLDPGTVQILARDVDRKSALELAQAVANDAGGILWETRAGDVSYADADHRKSTPVSITLDACDVLVAPMWSRTIAGLVNEATVIYGVATEGSERPVFTAERADSLARYGRYAYSTTTELADLDDASERAAVLVGRSGVPAWNVTALPLDLFILDDQQTHDVLALDMHAIVGIVDLPDGAPAERATLWVEGWSEHLAWEVHEITLAVSAYCRTSPPPEWDEAPEDMTWQDARDPYTLVPWRWDDASCFGGPPPSTGRWSDVPATVTWDDLATTTYWDTW